MILLRRITAWLTGAPKTSRFELGRQYALEALRSGRSREELEAEADNAFDHDDFDRGIIEVLRASPTT